MRLGINIPYDLHQRLMPLKQYVNVSQICRQAIEDRVRCYEKALASRNGRGHRARDGAYVGGGEREERDPR